MIFIPNAQANPSIVASGIAGGSYAVLYRCQRHGFEAQNRHWVFYVNVGTEYRSSTDGITWSSATTTGLGMYASFWTNGTHVFGTNPGNGPDNTFKLGILYGNGTIVFGTARSFTPICYYYAFVTVDANGIPWITGTNGTIDTSTSVLAFKGSDKNGTSWSLDARLTSFNAERYTSIILPFSNGDLYAVYKAYDTPTEEKDKFYGRYYNRTTSSWLAQQNITTGNLAGTTTYSALIDSTDKIWLPYINLTDSTLRLTTRTQTNTTWTTPITLATNLGAYPEITATVSGNNIYIFFASNTDYKVYVKAYVAGEWKEKSFVVAITNGHATQTQMSSYYCPTNRTIGLIWGEYTTTTSVNFLGFLIPALQIQSTPITSIPITVNGVSQSTPYNTTSPGTYTLSADTSIISGGIFYYFNRWTVNGVDYYESTVECSFSGTEDLTITLYYIRQERAPTGPVSTGKAPSTPSIIPPVTLLQEPRFIPFLVACGIIIGVIILKKKL